MTPDAAIRHAVALIATVPGYADAARDLSRGRIVFVADLADRGRASLLGTIRVGPETLQEDGDTALVSLAGTLIHEHWHTRQNPFLKTASFWIGIVTRRHPMRRFERPAYARQAAFLRALAAAHPPLAVPADQERRFVEASFAAFYGAETPDADGGA